MDKTTLDRANKAQLRAWCKQHAVAYGKLDNAGMRAALLAKLTKSDDYVRERLSDPVVIEVVKKAGVVRKVAAPSVLSLLSEVPVGGTVSCEAVAKRAGATVASVRTIVGSFNSTAPSNAKYHKTGIRFEVRRGEDAVKRTR